MGIWALIVISGLCTAASFYMTYLAFSTGGQGAYLFALFGLFFGIPFVSAVLKVAAGQRAVLKPKPLAFVPLWFIILALIVAAIGILVAIVIPLLSR